MARNVLVYGGKGALGSVLVEHLKGLGATVTSIDFVANALADHNIELKMKTPFQEQADTISAGITEGTKYDAILCVAGGWTGGNAGSKDFLKGSEQMIEQSMWSSLIAADLAAKHLKEKGILVLTGAKAALGPTPFMMGYGAAKAAVHHLVQSLGGNKSGLPDGARALAILPVTLDTPMNRKFMAYDGTWTPLLTVAEIISGWMENVEEPKSGSLVQLITKDGTTEQIIA